MNVWMTSLEDHASIVLSSNKGIEDLTSWTKLFKWLTTHCMEQTIPFDLTYECKTNHFSCAPLRFRHVFFC